MSDDIRLSLLDVLEYLDGTQNSRCIYKGEAILNSGHIVLCGKSDSDDNHISVYALVLQTSAMNSDPHTIQGEFLTSCPRVKVGKWSCSCKAGNSGHCKHISGVLIKCSRENLSALEPISQTDIKCIWAVQKYEVKEKYEAVPIREMPCFKNKIKEENLNFDENEMLNFFISQLPDSAIAQHRVGRSSGQVAHVEDADSLEENNLNFYTLILNNAAQSIIMFNINSLNFDIADCCMALIEKQFDQDPENIIQIVQKSKTLRSERQFRVTGSRCYEIYTYAKKDWNTKAVKYFWPKGFTNKYVKHGEKYEKNARDAFCSLTGFQIIECGLVVPHNNKWLGFSPDGIIFENNHDDKIIKSFKYET